MYVSWWENKSNTTTKLDFYNKHKKVVKYETYLDKIPKKIRKPGYLVMEVGHDQADRVGVLAKDLLPPHVFTVYQDLAGVNRFIMASIN